MSALGLGLWRWAETYCYLCNLGLMGFAWEFLRRNSEYKKDYRSIASKGKAAPEMSGPFAQRWRLRFWVDPDQRAGDTQIEWLNTAEIPQ